MRFKSLLMSLVVFSMMHISTPSAFAGKSCETPLTIFAAADMSSPVHRLIYKDGDGVRDFIISATRKLRIVPKGVDGDLLTEFLDTKTGALVKWGEVRACYRCFANRERFVWWKGEDHSQALRARCNKAKSDLQPVS